MSSEQMLSEQIVKADYSLYIPTLNKQYSADYITYIFWKFGIGNIDRLDFVSIMKPSKEEGVEPIEDPKFWQVFIYIRPNTEWSTFISHSVDENGSYRFYPHMLPHSNMAYQTNPNEYWVILKNKAPVPYAKTHLNIHQLAHNNSLLEAKVAEMEKEIAYLNDKTEFLNAELEDIKGKERMAEIIRQQEVDWDNEFSSIINQTFESEINVRHCCDCRDVELTGYAELCCPTCLEKRMNIACPSVCEKCDKNEVDNGNYICEECFYAIPAVDYIADLESGERTPRGYDNYEDDLNEMSPRCFIKDETLEEYEERNEILLRNEIYDYEEDIERGEISPREYYNSYRDDDDDDAEHDPGNRFRNGQGSLGCDWSDNEEESSAR